MRDLVTAQFRHASDGEFPHLLVRIRKKKAKCRLDFLAAQLPEVIRDDHPYMRIRVSGERPQHGESTGPCVKGDHPGSL